MKTKKSQTLTTIKPRGIFYLVLVLACFVGIEASTLEPCTENGAQKEVEIIKCGPFEEISATDIQNSRASDMGLSHKWKNSPNICPLSNIFCFPSTLSGFVSPESNDLQVDHERINLSWSLDSAKGRVISCSSSDHSNEPAKLTQNEASLCKRPKKSKEHSVELEVRPPIHVEVSPRVLNWGKQNLYIPTSSFISVKNTHSDRILDIYDPYSSSSQFYSCNFSEISLGPGEEVTICFVFLPTWVGLSSAKIVLQTSYGGFLINAKGVAEESLYGIESLVGIDVLPNVKLMKNLSLFNPFNEALSVKELTAWISVSSGNNTSTLSEAICSIKNIDDPNEFRFKRVKEWLNIGNLPIIAMRPHRNWEVKPGKTETIMELDFSYSFQGKIFGGFLMQLSSALSKKVYTVMVPLEAEWSENLALVSVFIEVIMPCDSDKSGVLALSVKNDALYPLRVVKVSEMGGSESKVFDIKYIEGLILFPRSTTQVALVTYTFFDIMEINEKCRIVILTNDSRNSQLEIPCVDVLSICSRHKLDSESIKGFDIGEADELVLQNWKSQASAKDMSVLDESVINFPIVQVGSHVSELINVQNPSEEPVMMQLILNSAEVIENCREFEKILLPSSSTSIANKSVGPTRFGFSIAENAVTEAFVHPHGKASLGPVFFHPSNRCGWKSSALVRNNLSGVEWLTLQGFGGSFSLVILEDFEPVQTLDFNLQFFSSIETVDKSYACSQSVTKVLHAKNTGDLSLEVSKIEVSGTECGLDGFSVNSCKGFSLEPGESKKLIVSYKTDFSTTMVQRDLEIGLTSGILVVPMKGSVSMQMFHICKRSILWTRVKKSLFAVFFAGSVVLVLVCCILPQVMDFSYSITKVVSSKTEPSEKKKGEEKVSTKKEIITPSFVAAPIQKQKELEENLMVKTVNEKKKRRRKKKNSGAGVGGVAGFEASSSHSGNSTPSSPLSPATTIRPWTPPHQPKNAFSQDSPAVKSKLEPVKKVETRKLPGRPVLLPSATFPSVSRPAPKMINGPYLPGVSTSKIAPHAKAPGSKLYDSGTVNVKAAEEIKKTGVEDMLTYDIWGSHLFELPLTGGSYSTVKKQHQQPLAIQNDNNSNSFFVKDLQILMKNSHKKSVSYPDMG